LITFTAIRQLKGLLNGREMSLHRLSQASSMISPLAFPNDDRGNRRGISGLDA
jgi:hypothetical protein